MEEEDAWKPNESSTKFLDPALQKKHQEMLERLSARYQARSSFGYSSSFSSSSSSSLESTSSFLSHFSDSKRSIESRIAESRLAATDPDQVKSLVTEISSSISDLEKLLAENSYFLPSYEIRSSLRSISDLRHNLESLSNELIPKKKFSFKNKSSSGNRQLPEIARSDAVSSREPDIARSGAVLPPIRDSPGFRNNANEVLVRSFRNSSVGEFTLSNLDTCEVRLIGGVNALFVNRLRNCKVYTGPVIGSVLIDDVEDCIFVLASHQIRIHCTKKSDFYLRVRSRPIIEDSNGVRFAPYCLEYEGIEEDLKGAGLEEETGNWANVDDFRWLRAVQSPNWCVLPEGERVDKVCISNSER